LIHPEGQFDGAGRWYPDASENLDTSCHRTPSRAWPYSYLQACRTAAHCAQLIGVEEVSLVRKFANIIAKCDGAEGAITAIERGIVILIKKQLRLTIRARRAPARVHKDLVAA
jgi:hypothetical protein